MNTYSILDTETLIKSHKRAKGKSEEEAKMILNHKAANEDEYKKAVLLFYEQNNLSYLKTLFIEQFKFACENYLS